MDKNRIKNAFSRAANEYDRHAQLQHDIRKECLSAIAESWPQNACILDIGCGTGALADDMKGIDKNWQLFGIDLAPGMCDIAHQHQVTTACASADALPFGDQRFDGVFCALMLQWAEDPMQVFREMARVLRPGSRAAIATFTQGTLCELRDSFATLDNQPHVNAFFEPMQLSMLAAHAGFALLSGERETITEYYPDAVSLMRSLKAIGASTTEHHSSGGLMTPTKLALLEKAYFNSFGDEEGLPATWEVMYMILERNQI